METIFTISTLALNIELQFEVDKQDYNLEKAKYEITEMHHILDGLKHQKLTKEEALEKYKEIDWFSEFPKLIPEEFEKIINDNII